MLREPLRTPRLCGLIVRRSFGPTNRKREGEGIPAEHSLGEGEGMGEGGGVIAR